MDNYTFRELIFSCPLDNEQESCPFRKMRIMEFTERIQHVYKLSDEVKQRMMQTHKECFTQQIERKYNQGIYVES